MNAKYEWVTKGVVFILFAENFSLLSQKYVAMN